MVHFLARFAITIFILLSISKVNAQSPIKAVVRWSGKSSNSSFVESTDGKNVYQLKDGDVEIAVSVDGQELEKVHHRALPLFAIHIESHYTGEGALDVKTHQITLEFVTHRQVTSEVLDPDELESRIQKDIDSLNNETMRLEKKDPGKKQQQQSSLQAHLKDMTDLLGFISLYSFRPSKLDSGIPTTSGWLFFNAHNRWIGKWQSQEEFVLRIPVEDRIFEFPFALPPRKGELVLRQRSR